LDDETPESTMPKYGLYSAKAAAKHGTIFYRGADGNEVEVTAVESNPDCYKWSDAENRGEVVGFVRDGRPRAQFGDDYKISPDTMALLSKKIRSGGPYTIEVHGLSEDDTLEDPSAPRF
jgi:hypothetical protein